jgi:energy-coupling factor transporter ATP-binding protein EcfA2
VTAKPDEPLSIIRQLELMRDLQRLANDRAQAESQIRTALDGGLHAAERERDVKSSEIESHYSASRGAAQAEYDASREATQQRYERERDAAQQQYKGLRHEVESTHAQVLRSAVTEQQESSWETLAVFDAIKGRPRERMLEAVRQLRANHAELLVLEGDATAIMKMRRQWQAFPPIAASTEGVTTGGLSDQSDGDLVERALERVRERTAAVREAGLALYDQRLPRLFENGNLLLPPFVAWLLAILPSGFLFGWRAWWLWLPISFGLAAVASAGLALWLYPRARRQSSAQFQIVRQLLADARLAIDAASDAAQERARRDTQVLISQRDQELAAVQQKLDATLVEKDRWKDSEMSQAGSVFPSRLAELRHWLEQESSAADRKLNETLASLADQRDRQGADSLARYESRCRELRTVYDRDWESLANRWFTGYNVIRDSWLNISSQCERLFPDWETTDEHSWQRPAEPPAAIRFGRVKLDLASVKNGIPQDERLRLPQAAVALPALMTLKEHPVMVLTAEDEGRRAAVDVLQATMLRFLTAMPPGKVRFTILDPVGLGESFGSFMHLADHDELLISSRIWTETRQIEEQLTRLTAHMETVLQKYLRNEFATIDDYNATAGEVAEPFHVLVVANYPANFSETAARKLVSIATSGPRCGVYTLVSVDRKLRLPNDVPLDDLMANAVHLDWQPAEKRFRWRYPAFEQLPLTLDAPPSPERFNDVVRAAGAAAKKAMRVEVPFEVVAPADDQLWTGNSAQELVVPIGRAGAMRLQSVRLGRGTSQHLLVAGKTGSGKSTFLHALITNAALHYSPDEVEFYLIDFKKGVEFKTYATHRLPHARVIAIESEREFGLSVLERLDVELRRRGELFRAAGVQDLAAYRAANPTVKMPRVMLVIDEFQELFVEDDKLSQDAALLLDRLVRQGRAFGVHVLLGSQTLSGAYSLARSTMGQMAVRVALQCSEADSHLILSDERNMAARYLSRPGEAIYNDQNGLLAGNQPFQVVWLSESKRVDYLRKLEEYAAARGQVSAPAIVFEGDQAADPAQNEQLAGALRAGAAATAAGGPKAWLGAAVAIKEPTAVTFARHAGSNLLVVGSEEESAFGTLANAVIALSAQPAARFLVLDGTRPDSEHAGAWQRLAAALPNSITVAGPREVARVVAEVAAEMVRRESADEETAAPWYLVIHDAGRFRELRRNEDDFGFSRDRDKPTPPDRQWSEILRNGPAWGIHSLVWCDSYNDVNRLVDRQTLREFELRVLFQMSAADSTNLLDTPAASRLRPHRGLFYSDDLGTQEKFRPYGPPSEEWLARVRAALSA